MYRIEKHPILDIPQEETVEFLFEGHKVRATKGLCQIPYNQIVLSNNVLKQNAGW